MSLSRRNFIKRLAVCGLASLIPIQISNKVIDEELKRFDPRFQRLPREVNQAIYDSFVEGSIVHYQKGDTNDVQKAR